MEQCARLCDLSLSLLLLCVDGELVCAEGCTQVTGVMAMMMTGRVLLVCALCVLWSVVADGDVGVVSGGDDNSLKELFIPVARLQERPEQRAAGATADAKAAAAAKASAEAAERAKIATAKASAEKAAAAATEADAKTTAAKTAEAAAEALRGTTIREQEVKTAIHDQDNSVEHHSGEKQELLQEQEPERQEKEQHEKQQHQQREHSAGNGEESPKEKTS
ncbi:mucin-associated surface protein (MASP) [Trypanosoma cruzi]|nr:mucin-associated surface protein (MASP) [Trypanosoma cruzi]